MQRQSEKPLLSVSKMARERLGISTPYSYKLIAEGAIPHISINGAIRIAEEDIAEFIRQRRWFGIHPGRRNPRKGRRGNNAK